MRLRLICRKNSNGLLGVMLILAVLSALASQPAVAARPRTAKQAYEVARSQYYNLKSSHKKKQFRHNWIRVIASFKLVVKNFPNSAEAPRALYTMAGLWKDLYRISIRDSDLNQALASYARVVERYGDNSLADDALWTRSEALRKYRRDMKSAARDIKRLLSRYPQSDMAGRAGAWAKSHKGLMRTVREPESKPPRRGQLQGRRAARSGPVSVNDIKYWTNPVYTRVAIYLDGATEFRSDRLGANTSADKPARIFLDIDRATVGSKARAPRIIEDNLLSRIRVAQHDGDTVRVVLDLKNTVHHHRVLVMENPYRVVIDAYSVDNAKAEVRAPSASALKSNYRPLVVIDPGHGGNDSGALGPNEIKEKDVVLAVSRRVAQQLRKAGLNVRLTRSEDKFVPLEERTAMANRWDADVFVSVHANSHKQESVRGVETYYLDVTDDHYAIKLAALENQTNEERVSDIQLVLADLSTKLHTEESSELAETVQGHLVQANKKVNKQVRDLGVKASLFYVLLGAHMPSILVELGFISNTKDSKLLTSTRYQERIAKALSDAITGHLRQRQPEGS